MYCDISVGQKSEVGALGRVTGSGRMMEVFETSCWAAGFNLPSLGELRGGGSLAC
jgi:hypothetical protein